LDAAKSGHSATLNNCSNIVGKALKAGGLLGSNAAIKLPGLVNSYMTRRVSDGRVSTEIYIPKGASQGWDAVNQLMGPFNPR